MAKRYIEVPAQALEDFLASKGFTRTLHRHEVVYTRKHSLDPRYSVLVYTSIRPGAQKARACGADAIRVCAIFTPEDLNKPTRGVAKLPRVYRTGSVSSVLERVLERSREAYAVCNRHVRAAARGSSTRVDAACRRCGLSHCPGASGKSCMTYRPEPVYQIAYEKSDDR